MKVYVASSWRNPHQQSVVSALRDDGHDVYDFRNPGDGSHGFHWTEIDPNWKSWTPARYCAGLGHQLAIDGFKRDMDTLRNCDAVVAVQPFGRSASLELGWACGAGKFTVLLLDSGEPELMVKMCNRICLSIEEVKNALAGK